ncbi:hypothetical protein AVEN_93379-1 [Araneus ventricosus]|uniref:Uncharacterized protein n=1 Tax=Araneus ventricosus TaxID=182803 RepID=A0A4Y2APZ3_ARAVE|nr:hypothetical protein AVEN_93379-1 [Araneus ventricosus]
MHVEDRFQEFSSPPDNARPHTARLTEERSDEFWRQLLHCPELNARFSASLARLSCKRFATPERGEGGAEASAQRLLCSRYWQTEEEM